MQTLAKGMISSAFRAMRSSTSRLTLSSKEAVDCVSLMLAERRDRCANLPPRRRPHPLEDLAQVHDTIPPVPTATSTLQDIDKPLDAHKEKESVSPQTIDDRDPEVSDEVWSQLQSDKQAADLGKSKWHDEPVKMLWRN